MNIRKNENSRKFDFLFQAQYFTQQQIEGKLYQIFIKKKKTGKTIGLDDQSSLIS